jgi:hypothetical protein
MSTFVSEITAWVASSACFKSFRLAVFMTSSRNSFLVIILQPPFPKIVPNYEIFPKFSKGMHLNKEQILQFPE